MSFAQIVTHASVCILYRTASFTLPSGDHNHARIMRTGETQHTDKEPPRHTWAVITEACVDDARNDPRRRPAATYRRMLPCCPLLLDTMSWTAVVWPLRETQSRQTWGRGRTTVFELRGLSQTEDEGRMSWSGKGVGKRPHRRGPAQCSRGKRREIIEVSVENIQYLSGLMLLRQPFAAEHFPGIFFAFQMQMFCGMHSTENVQQQ